jgi:hypothetical protein
MSKRLLSGLALYLLSGVLAAHAGQFLEAPQYATGANPQAVAVGDFNGDGKLDVAVANSVGNNISILLGNGDGTFKPQVTYAADTSPQGIAVGDFNGDGHLDIAVTNSGSNLVSVFLGNGDGTFQPKVDYATGSQPKGIAVADLNGDSHPDIVLTNAGGSPGTVGVLLGKGDGTFKAQVTYTTGLNPWAVAIGDFNNDGIPDLAVANNNNNNVVSILLGKGDGTFQSQFQSPTGNTPVSIALADFNGDGNLDMAVADQQGNAVSILLGNGKGGFAANVDYNTGAFPTAVTIGDFNHDGILDLGVSDSNGNSVTVLWGKGDGTFYGQLNVGSGDIPYAAVAGDFNHDGSDDLVVANSGGNSVSVILSNGNQTFQSRTDYVAGANARAVATADFNGDGFLDLAVVNSNCPNFPSCSSGTVSIVLGNGDGTFQGPTAFSTDTAADPDTDPHAVVVKDFNGDGIPDLAVADYATNTVSILSGNGDGTFTAPVTFAVGSEPTSLAIGDFNGDGKFDLAVTNFHSNTISILLGNGLGSFTTAPCPALTCNVGNGPISIAVGDFNGDHIPDLVVVNESDNNVGILLGNGDGTFKKQVVYSTSLNGVGGNPLSVVIGDFNGDGFLDLAVADYQTEQVSVLLGNGDGTFQSFQAYSTGANPSSILAADFNGDGKLDLALTSTPLGSSAGNVVSLLLGNGNGTFAPYALFGAGYLSYSAVVGDFNGDGAKDIAVANGGSNTVSLLLNVQGTAISFVPSPKTSTFGESVTLTAKVAASVSNGSAPTGSVTFKNGSSVIASGPLANGEYSVSTSTLPVGNDSLSAVYSGDSNYQSHTVTVSYVVSPAVAFVLAASALSPSSVVAGGSSSSIVTITPSGGLDPSTVVLSCSSIVPGTNPAPMCSFSGITVANGIGSATLTVFTSAPTAALAGQHRPLLYAIWLLLPAAGLGLMLLPRPRNGKVVAMALVLLISGACAFQAACGGGGSNTTPPPTKVASKSASSTAVTSSANPSLMGQAITLTATVSASSGAPTGTVTFLDGSTTLGTGTLASGTATFQASALTPGTHSVTAAYGGDTNFNSSSSGALSQVVDNPGTASGTYTITVAGTAAGAASETAAPLALTVQ